MASLYYFWHAVAGGPAVSGFPAVEGVLAVASVPANSGVPILVRGFTYWNLEWDILTIELSDYGYQAVIFFLLSNYWNIKYRIGEIKKLSDYRISYQGLNLSSLHGNSHSIPNLCYCTCKCHGKKSLLHFPTVNFYLRTVFKGVDIKLGKRKNISFTCLLLPPAHTPHESLNIGSRG